MQDLSSLRRLATRASSPRSTRSGGRGPHGPGQRGARAAKRGASGAGRTGDRVLFWLCAAAGIIVAITLVDIVYQLIDNADPAISRFGFGFLVHNEWNPHFGRLGAATLIFGTLASSLMALAIAGPLGISIAIYLSMMASPKVRAVVGPVVEMLAAVPSIVYGFWGLIVLVPFIHGIEPGLHDALGWIPLFGPPQTTGLSIFTAGLVLTFMILPIISSLSRDLFLTVPTELQEGAQAVGATQWEVIRGIVLPSTLSGVSAAMVLALGRALGEAIAISFIIGDVSQISANLFHPGATLASRIVNQFLGTSTSLGVSALWYAGLVLLVITLITSLLARWIAGRFDVERRYARAETA
jgi:phosphate transport system permease protein